MQKVYGLISDNGDGSASIDWFKDQSIVENLLENCEEYGVNEGLPAETLIFPEDFDLVEYGFCFSDKFYERED